MPYLDAPLRQSGFGAAKKRRPPSIPVSPTGTGLGTAPGTVTVPGSTPDYKGLALSDPTFSEFKQHMSAQGVSDSASRQRMIRDTLIRYGDVPGGIEDPYGDINDETRTLAAENPYSFARRQQQEYEDRARAMRAALAARGLLSSGQAAFETQRLGRTRGESEYQARSELLRSIFGAHEGYAAAERQRQLELSGQLSESVQRQAELYPASPSSTATLDADMVGPNGEPVYRGPDGRYYDINGAVVTPRPKVPNPLGGGGGLSRVM